MLGSDQLNNKNKKRVSSGVEFKTDVYGFLDDFLHDETEEVIVSTRNKYFAFGAKQFLEDMNFTFMGGEPSEPRMVISMLNGNFKFIDHMEEHVTIELPYDWDIMESNVRAFVTENPIVKKEVTHNSENWDQPEEDQNGKDAIDGVKDWVKEIQKKLNIGAEEAAKMASGYIKKLYHGKNETSYQAKGNPDIKLSSGIYNNMEDLVNKNGWASQFRSDYNESIREYMRDNNLTGSEENLLVEFGFEHILENVVVDEHRYWNNRIIEVKYKDQDDEEMETIDKSEFEVPVEVDNTEIDKTIDEIIETLKVDDSKDLDGEFQILQTFDNESIVIVGCDIDGNYDFSLTDDFSDFTVQCGNETIDVESNGFVSILTIDEFKKNKDFIFENDCGSVLIPNMKGDLRIGAESDDGTFTSRFDLGDYIYQQLDDHNVVVKTPDGMEMREVNERTWDIVSRNL
tara:strand:- start:10885 stop:12252 length:1368 start_codon:yes stop_codon:yes gene_type:complete